MGRLSGKVAIVLVVTHDPAFAAKCDRIIPIVDGKVGKPATTALSQPA
jgi:ABC-type lipoprotein export system ATPase subunit